MGEDRYSEIILTYKKMFKMWENDCIIDDKNLEKESMKTPIIHNRYFNIFIKIKFYLVELESDFDEKILKRYNYYSGNSSPEEYKTNPLDMKIKNNTHREILLNGDKDLKVTKLKVSRIKIILEWFSSVLQQIKNRDWQIKNAIEIKIFNDGG